MPKITPTLIGCAFIILFVIANISPVLADETMTTFVNTQPLSELVIHPRRSAPASTLSLNDSEISAELNARILSIPVRVGDSVTYNQVLAVLNCEDYQLQLRESRAAAASAKAGMELADKQLKRARILIERQNVSKQMLNQRETELWAAHAELETNQARREKDALNITRCIIRAPFDGVVLERLADIGEWAKIGTPVVRLVDKRRLEVSAQIRVQYSRSLETAENRWFLAAGIKYPLRLRVITPVIDKQSRSREVRLPFTNHSALPGSAGRLVWQDSEPHISAKLLVRRGNQLGVFTAENQQARFKPLAGALEGEPARIPLPLESMIIIQGHLGLKDGEKINNRKESN